MAYTSDLLPRQKAAILMVLLGREYSSKVYKCLSQEEIEQLTLAITNLDRIDSELSDRVLEEFHDITLAQKYVTEGGIEYARDVLVAAVGAEQADALLSRLTASLQVRPFDFVRRADSAQVFNFIQNEHPQTIALVLSYLDTSRAALILGSLPRDMQAQVIKRIARMGIVSPDYIREAERVLERKFGNVGYTANVAVGGLDTIVDILNSVDRGTETFILSSIEQEDPDLAEEIHNRLFVFEDLIKLTDLSLQKVLKEVDNDVLTIALKNASEQINTKIFKNISKRLQETIDENMKFMGPVRVRDVEAAQQKIVNVVRRLEDAGVIDVARGGREDEIIA
ncbi:MAG: flagellar motor switch protein FliG [Candidatus Pelethousia sp.]|nr:flagellar motor switch protein FliG [Candidatus Pelethousia sp.]